jgi:hypothetical protein
MRLVPVWGASAVEELEPAGRDGFLMWDNRKQIGYRETMRPDGELSKACRGNTASGQSPSLQAGSAVSLSDSFGWFDRPTGNETTLSRERRVATVSARCVRSQLRKATLAVQRRSSAMTGIRRLVFFG